MKASLRRKAKPNRGKTHFFLEHFKHIQRLWNQIHRRLQTWKMCRSRSTGLKNPTVLQFTKCLFNLFCRDRGNSWGSYLTRWQTDPTCIQSVSWRRSSHQQTNIYIFIVCRPCWIKAVIDVTFMWVLGSLRHYWKRKGGCSSRSWSKLSTVNKANSRRWHLDVG